MLTERDKQKKLPVRNLFKSFFFTYIPVR